MLQKEKTSPLSFPKKMRLEIIYPDIAPPHKRGKPACGLPFITKNIKTEKPTSVPNIVDRATGKLFGML